MFSDSLENVQLSTRGWPSEESLDCNHALMEGTEPSWQTPKTQGGTYSC